MVFKKVALFLIQTLLRGNGHSTSNRTDHILLNYYFLHLDYKYKKVLTLYTNSVYPTKLLTGLQGADQ